MVLCCVRNAQSAFLNTTQYIVCAAKPREYPAREGEASENQTRSERIRGKERSREGIAMGLQEPLVAAVVTSDVSAPHTRLDVYDTRWYGRWIVLVISGLALALGMAFVWLHGASS